MPKPFVSVVVPCFNEIKTLDIVLDRVAKNLVDFRFEIIIVDDASTDGSRNHLLDLESEKRIPLRVIFHDVNKGIGAALKSGFAS